MFKFEKLKQLRKKRKLNNSQLCLQLYKQFDFYVSHTSLRKWEEGSAMPRANAIGYLSKFYNVPINEFFQKNK